MRLVFSRYFILTPDLDTYSNAYNKWGFLRIFWYPYKKVMPHRSFFTHTIILGDVIRIAYMLIVFSPFLFLLNVIALDGNLIEIAKKHEVEIVTFLMGIVVASTLHIIADKVNTRRKKMMRKRRNAEDKVNESGKGPLQFARVLLNKRLFKIKLSVL